MTRNRATSANSGQKSSRTMALATTHRAFGGGKGQQRLAGERPASRGGRHHPGVREETNREHVEKRGPVETEERRQDAARGEHTHRAGRGRDGVQLQDAM